MVIECAKVQTEYEKQAWLFWMHLPNLITSESESQLYFAPVSSVEDTELPRYLKKPALPHATSVKCRKTQNFFNVVFRQHEHRHPLRTNSCFQALRCAYEYKCAFNFPWTQHGHPLRSNSCIHALRSMPRARIVAQRGKREYRRKYVKRICKIFGCFSIKLWW